MIGDEKSFEEMLAALPRTRPPTSIEADRWAFREAASVVRTFEPLELVPARALESKRDALQLLAADCAIGDDGKWMLKLRARQQALSRLIQEGRLEKALAINSDFRGPETVLLEEMTSGRSLPLRGKTLQQLREIAEVSEWLGPRSTVAEDDISRAMAERQTLEPFYALAGDGFVGRERELDVLKRFIVPGKRSKPKGPFARLVQTLTRAEVDRPALFIFAAGGMGKSTLLARFILDQVDAATESGRPPIPYAYVDFDDRRVSIRSTATLLTPIAEQFRAEYEDVELLSTWDELTLLATEPSSRARLVETDRQVQERYGVDRQVRKGEPSAVGDVLGRFLSEVASRWYSAPPPFLLVLDTFEQSRATARDGIGFVGEFIEALRAGYPPTRVVLSGRAYVKGLNARRLELSGLRREDALALLSARGVEDPSLRAAIVDYVGQSPLSLRLAAQAVETAALDHDAIRGMSDVVSQIDRAQVEGMLYDRILRHIADPQVRRIAHPGLIVRYITPRIIASVLAEPCRIDPSTAGDVFDRLAADVTLFERGTGRSLRHRKDVRNSMLRSMRRQYERTVREIHRRAIEFHSGEDSDRSRAEVLYHRLARGDDPRDLDPLWEPELAGYFSDTLDEPLHPASATWLAARLGEEGEIIDWRAVPLHDWETHTAVVARELLDSDAPERALDRLRDRGERSASSPLFALEAEALDAMGKGDHAAMVVGDGLSKIAGSGFDAVELDLRLTAARLAARSGDLFGASRSVARAVDLARALETPRAEIEARLLMWQTQSQYGDDREALEEVELELIAAVVRTPDARLFDETELIRAVVDTVGSRSPLILETGVNVLGLPSTRAAGPLGELVAQVADRDESFNSYVRGLARNLGIDAHESSWTRLGAEAIRTGEVDSLLKRTIDAGGYDENVRRRLADLLVMRPAGRPIRKRRARKLRRRSKTKDS